MVKNSISKPVLRVLVISKRLAPMNFKKKFFFFSFFSKNPIFQEVEKFHEKSYLFFSFFSQKKLNFFQSFISKTLVKFWGVYLRFIKKFVNLVSFFSISLAVELGFLYRALGEIFFVQKPYFSRRIIFFEKKIFFLPLFFVFFLFEWIKVDFLW